MALMGHHTYPYFVCIHFRSFGGVKCKPDREEGARFSGDEAVTVSLPKDRAAPGGLQRLTMLKD